MGINDVQNEVINGGLKIILEKEGLELIMKV